MKKRGKYSPEVRERAVRMVFEHESEHGSQWETIISIASKIGCTAETLRQWVRLAEAGVEPSVGSAGDSYDNALAETVIGLCKTEVIRRRGPWRHLEAVEFATVEWVDWFNNRRFLEAIGNILPMEFEEAYYRTQEAPAMVVRTQITESPENPARFTQRNGVFVDSE